MLFGSRQQTYTLAGVAQFALPGGWAQGTDDRQAAWTAIPFRKSQSWHFGSGDPCEVEGWVILGSPRSTADDLTKGMDFAMREVLVRASRFPEFGNMRTGERTTWMSEGSYQIASNHDPEKVIFLRSIDPVKQAALVLRVYERKIGHESLRAIERDFFASLTYQDPGRAKYFSETPLSVAARERRREEIAYINRFLKERGLPAMDPHNPYQVQAHNGWVYQVDAGRFLMGRRLGDQNSEDSTANAAFDWLESSDDAWSTHAPGNRRRPANGPYYQSQPVPTAWSKPLALDTDRTRRYFFHVWICELTPEDSPESHSPVTWELEGWFAYASKLERVR